MSLLKNWKTPSETEMKSKFGAHFRSPLVEVRIGRDPNVHVLQVHESALTGASEYFKRCLRFDGIERKTRSIILDDEVHDPDAFYLFLEIAYNQRIEPEYTAGDGFKEGHLVLLTKLYVLGERLQSDLSIDLMFELLQRRFAETQRLSKIPSFYLKDLIEAVQIIYWDTPTPEETELVTLEEPHCHDFEPEPVEIGDLKKDLDASRQIRKIFVRYVGYNIKAIREQYRVEFGQLIRACDRDFAVDLLLNEDLISNRRHKNDHKVCVPKNAEEERMNYLRGRSTCSSCGK